MLHMAYIGTWSSNSITRDGTATSCQSWAVCAAGSYVSTQPSSSNDRTCTPCGSETFSSEINQDFCTVQHCFAAFELFSAERHMLVTCMIPFDLR